MPFDRYELKYYLNPLQTRLLGEQLKHILATDPHGDSRGEYPVHSLYFDSMDDECLYQKQSGLRYRSKLRLRTYGPVDRGPVNFEIKHKSGQRVCKETVAVPVEIAREVCNGEYRGFLEMNTPVADRIYALFLVRTYRPVVIVSYLRQAFVFPALNVRVTLDSNLHSDINHLDMLGGARGYMPAILEGKQILELKYNQYFPDHLRRLLSGVCTERMAISKYTLARRFHKSAKWEDN